MLLICRLYVNLNKHDIVEFLLTHDIFFHISVLQIVSSELSMLSDHLLIYQQDTKGMNSMARII